jgi:hypothetical protein
MVLIEILVVVLFIFNLLVVIVMSYLVFRLYIVEKLLQALIAKNNQSAADTHIMTPSGPMKIQDYIKSNEDSHKEAQQTMKPGYFG